MFVQRFMLKLFDVLGAVQSSSDELLIENPCLAV